MKGLYRKYTKKGKDSFNFGIGKTKKKYFFVEGIFFIIIFIILLILNGIL